MADNDTMPLVIINRRPTRMIDSPTNRVPLTKEMFNTMRGRPPDPANVNKIDVLGDMKKGGTVPKTGVYRLHKGERVVPAKTTPRTSPKRKR
jgi:hypothetical protein